MPVSAEDTQQIGLGILQRIAVREKARLHKEFLTRLYELPLPQDMLICGSMALHGVYLHKRWSKDLDFEASTEIALGFQEIAAQAGLNVTLREGWEGPYNSMTAVPYVFSSSSAFYPEVAIGVEIFPYEQRFVAAERRAFTTEVGEQVMVVVKPLAEVMAAKIGCMFQRNKATVRSFQRPLFGLSSKRLDPKRYVRGRKLHSAKHHQYRLFAGTAFSAPRHLAGRPQRLPDPSTGLRAGTRRPEPLASYLRYPRPQVKGEPISAT